MTRCVFGHTVIKKTDEDEFKKKKTDGYLLDETEASVFCVLFINIYQKYIKKTLIIYIYI